MPASMLQRSLRLCAWLACALVVGMVAIFALTGVGQDPLQFVHPAAEYTALLLRNPAALRATLGLDNLFLVLYSTVFVLLAGELNQRGAPRLLLGVSAILLLALGLLDTVENFHFMAMLAAAEQGRPPSDAEISWQVVESLFKFHVSYLGLFLLGLAMPRVTQAQRLLANLSVYLQLPVGVAIYVLPQALAVPLVFVRFSYFVLALAMVGWLYGAGRDATRAAAMPSAASGSGAPA